MFGIILLASLVIGGTVHVCKNSLYDDKSKQQSVKENRNYYLDWQGYRRRVDNNHKVLIHVTDFKTGDKVDMDMKTGEVLKNYSKALEIKEKEKENQIRSENIKRKQEAKNRGDLWYTSYEKINDTKVFYSPWAYVKKRVSDDLLLSNNSTGVILYDNRFELALDNELLDEETKLKLAKRNKVLFDAQWLYQIENITKEELLRYAKKIGALI